MAEIYVEGNLLLRSKQGGKNGEKRYRLKWLSKLQLLDIPNAFKFANRSIFIEPSVR
jgi:hypothetical protein